MSEGAKKNADKEKLKKVLKSGARGFLEGTGAGYLAQSPGVVRFTKNLSGRHPAELVPPRVRGILRRSGLAQSAGKGFPWMIGLGMGSYRMGRSISNEYIIPGAEEVKKTLFGNKRKSDG